MLRLLDGFRDASGTLRYELALSQYKGHLGAIKPPIHRRSPGVATHRYSAEAWPDAKTDRVNQVQGRLPSNRTSLYNSWPSVQLCTRQARYEKGMMCSQQEQTSVTGTSSSYCPVACAHSAYPATNGSSRNYPTAVSGPKTVQEALSSGLGVQVFLHPLRQ